jgi:hypothetical protein
MGWFSSITNGITRSMTSAPKRTSPRSAAPERKKHPLGLSPRDTNGPVVPTRPTAGYNRARNKDGRWRRKNTRAPAVNNR